MWSVASSQRLRNVKKAWGAGVVDGASCRFLVIVMPWLSKAERLRAPGCEEVVLDGWFFVVVGG